MKRSKMDSIFGIFRDGKTVVLMITAVISVIFGFASGVGFTMAILIFAGVRSRMQFSNPPHSFKGTPIALITAGLIAMAFMGFSGMKIG